ncbi:MAG TPA: DNA-binding domain-containing protein [Steroidobacteraceae bacterium]|nr:DNA-binding domain-containing protein [Steroidobacteraceae bacterium]
MSTIEQLQRDLQRHVIEGDVSIAQAIHGSVDVPAATRLGVYFDAYRLRLIEALESNYPILAKAMTQFRDEHAFGRLTQQYLSVHPSRHFSIRWFGDRLAEFLTQHPDYCTERWMAELTSWEWSVAGAFDSLDAKIVALTDLGTVAPDEWAALRLKTHPSVTRLRLTTNVPKLIKAYNNSQLLPDPEAATATDWLIWRQDLDVQFRSLPPVEAGALDAVVLGTDFGTVCEVLAEFIDADEVPLQAASFLKQWIVDQCLVRADAE